MRPILRAMQAFCAPLTLRPTARSQCVHRAAPRACAPSAAPRARGAHTAPMHRIRLLACDMDGTMLDSASKISAQNIRAVGKLLDYTNVRFIPATGKSRSGALRCMGDLGDILRELHPAGVPGVYAQGLVVYGDEGELVFEASVDADVGAQVATLANDLKLSLIGYSRDDILCEDHDDFTALLPVYHEPACTAIGDWQTAFDSRTLNKFIFMANPQRIDEIRPTVQRALGDRAVLTQAQGNMLEVLPRGTSKGNGLRRLLEAWRIDPAHVMAIGDAENDLEMLKMVGTSCAVSNALPSVKNTARFGVPSNDDAGVAAAIHQFILAQ